MSKGLGEKLINRMETREFSFEVRDNVKIAGTMIIMDKSCYVWLGCQNEPCMMSSLATAIPTRFSGTPLSTTLLNDGTDNSSDMAQRLAQKFGIQVYLSCNLPPSYDMHFLQIDKAIINLLQEHF